MAVLHGTAQSVSNVQQCTESALSHTVRQVTSAVCRDTDRHTTVNINNNQQCTVRTGFPAVLLCRYWPEYTKRCRWSKLYSMDSSPTLYGRVRPPGVGVRQRYHTVLSIMYHVVRSVPRSL